MFDFLEREGAQVIVEPIATWVAYLMYQAKAHAIAKWPVNRPHRNPDWYEVKKNFVNYIGLHKKLWGIGFGEMAWRFFDHRAHAAPPLNADVNSVDRMDFPSGPALRVRATPLSSLTGTMICVKEQLTGDSHRSSDCHLCQMRPDNWSEVRTDFGSNRVAQVVAGVFNQIYMNVVVLRTQQAAIGAFGAGIADTVNEGSQTDQAAFAHALRRADVHNVSKCSAVCRNPARPHRYRFLRRDLLQSVEIAKFQWNRWIRGAEVVLNGVLQRHRSSGETLFDTSGIDRVRLGNCRPAIRQLHR
jgi:hypothetical protein